MNVAVAADQAVRTEPKRVSVALVVATLVTLSAAIPLGVVAWSARDSEPAASDGLVVASVSGAEPLAGQTLPRGIAADLQLIEPDFVAIAWTLYGVDEGLITSDEVVGTSPFILDVETAAFPILVPGTYDLLVTGTERDGTVVQRAARFAIGDAP